MSSSADGVAEERKNGVSVEDQVREAFQKCADKDGKLDRKSFYKLAAILGGDQNKGELDIAFNSMDRDASGFIDVMEFASWWNLNKAGGDDEDEDPLVSDDDGSDSDEGSGKFGVIGEEKKLMETRERHKGGKKSYEPARRKDRFAHHANPECHDRIWAIAFLVLFCGFLSVGILYAGKFNAAMGGNWFNANDGPSKAIKAFLVSILVANVLQIAWFEVLRRAPGHMIVNSIIAFFTIFFASTLLMILSRFWGTALGCILVICAMIGFVVRVNEHVEFATIILRSALRGLKENAVIVSLSYLVTFFSALFQCIWAFVLVFLLNDSGYFLEGGMPKNASVSQWVLCVLLFVFYALVLWTLTNIVQTLSAAVSSSWWLDSAELLQQKSRAGTAFQRAFLQSFGSLFHEALAKPIIKVRSMFRPLCAKDRMDWLSNPYACVHIGLYGERYGKSAHVSAEFLVESNYLPVLNTEITWIPIVFGFIMFGGMCNIATQVYLDDRTMTFSQVNGIAVIAALIGFFSTTVLAMVEGATAASFINFVESAKDMQQSRTRHYELLYEAHRDCHLQTMLIMADEGRIVDRGDLKPRKMKEVEETTDFEERLHSRKFKNKRRKKLKVQAVSAAKAKKDAKKLMKEARRQAWQNNEDWDEDAYWARVTELEDDAPEVALTGMAGEGDGDGDGDGDGGNDNLLNI